MKRKSYPKNWSANNVVNVIVCLSTPNCFWLHLIIRCHIGTASSPSLSWSSWRSHLHPAWLKEGGELLDEFALFVQLSTLRWSILSLHFHSARDLLHHKKGFSRLLPLGPGLPPSPRLPWLLCSACGREAGRQEAGKQRVSEPRLWLFVFSSTVDRRAFCCLLVVPRLLLRLVLCAFSIWWDEKFHWNWFLLWGPSDGFLFSEVQIV